MSGEDLKDRIARFLKLFLDNFLVIADRLGALVFKQLFLFSREKHLIEVIA